jgi:hypothetical protein
VRSFYHCHVPGGKAKLLVCLECGFTEFTVPERELSVFVKGEALEGAVVLEKKVGGGVGSAAADGRGLASVQVLNRQSNTDKVSAVKK